MRNNTFRLLANKSRARREELVIVLCTMRTGDDLFRTSRDCGGCRIWWVRLCRCSVAVDSAVADMSGVYMSVCVCARARHISACIGRGRKQTLPYAGRGEKISAGCAAGYILELMRLIRLMCKSKSSHTETKRIEKMRHLSIMQGDSNIILFGAEHPLSIRSDLATDLFWLSRNGTMLIMSS